MMVKRSVCIIELKYNEVKEIRGSPPAFVCGAGIK
jgi:hypothetical protein